MAIKFSMVTNVLVFGVFCDLEYKCNAKMDPDYVSIRLA